MYQIEYTNRMKRDVKRMKKRGKDMNKLTPALNLLASGNPLPKSYFDHPILRRKVEMKNRELLPGRFISDQHDVPVHLTLELLLKPLDFRSLFRGNICNFKVVQSNHLHGFSMWRTEKNM